MQPAFLDERPSARPDWKGLSSNVFLDQVHRRHTRGVVLSLGVTSQNISPGSEWNFVFGLGYLGLGAAVMSFHQLRERGRAPREIVHERALKIALHELGHGLGLDHHSYADRTTCSMVGDVEADSLQTIDESDAKFCADCLKAVRFPARVRQHA